MCTLLFLKDVLKGSKTLLKTSDVTGIPKIPRIPEINSADIWKDIKGDPEIAKYFPDSFVHSNRVPDRNFMFTVL